MEDLPVPEAVRPTVPVWFWPAILGVTGLLALLGALLDPKRAELWTLLPYTYVGNSLAPLPYDGAVIWLGSRWPLWEVVAIGVVGTVLVEYWNMELLARIMSRDGTKGFRKHRLTRGVLVLFTRFPFMVLFCTCAFPIIPHYPMRLLAVLAQYPMWKYQLTVIFGRGARYVWLGAIGAVFKIPTWILVVASLLALFFGWRQAKKMNREGADH